MFMMALFLVKKKQNRIFFPCNKNECYSATRYILGPQGLLGASRQRSDADDDDDDDVEPFSHLFKKTQESTIYFYSF